MFERELDRYEETLSGRVGAVVAHDARREMTAHLEADYAARLEAGLAPSAARRQALEAIGDLRTVAFEEKVASIRFGFSWALPMAAACMIGGWSVPFWNEGVLRLALTLLAAGLTIGAAITVRRSLGKDPGTRVERALALIPALLTLGAYLPLSATRVVDLSKSPSRLPEAFIVGAILSAATIATASGALHRRVAWTTSLLAGSAIFVAQTAGVEISLSGSGAHVGYPLDVTLGTWLAFTLPLLLLSTLGAAVSRAIDRTRVRLRTVSR